MGEMLSKSVAGSSDRVWNCYHSRVMRTKPDNRSKLGLDLDRLSCTMSLTGTFPPVDAVVCSLLAACKEI